MLRSTLLALLCLLPSAQAGDTPAPSDTLPRPRPLLPTFTLPPLELMDFPRANRYEVWQNVGVARRGTFRPLVVYTPYGSFYRYNGAPFFFEQTQQQREWLRMMAGHPYRPALQPLPPMLEMDFMPYIED